VAEQHEQDPSTQLLVVPVKTSECLTCPWWGYCRPQLEAGSGDVSLLPRVGYTEWRAHRNHGVTDRAELAALDVRTATLVAAGIDLTVILGATEHLRGNVPLEGLQELPLRQADRAVLTEAGVITAEDLRTLEGRTLAYCDAPMGSLPQQIDLARAALGQESVYRRRGVPAIVVPRGDIEVDVDMENVETGCYLWGALVTDRSGCQLVDSGYRAFVTWEPMTAEVEAQNSFRFWTWLVDLKRAAQKAGLRFRAYCYNAAAENQYLFRLGVAMGIQEAVEAFVASDEWVDVLRVWDSQLITGGSSGLKVVAPIAGFRWEVDDAGGEQSMLMYDVAVSAEAGAAAARNWLLTYNRGDVEATLRIRDWLETAGSTILPIEALEPV